MATYNVGPFLTRIAGADLSASTFKIVVQQADRTVVLANAATQNFLGVVHLGAKQGGEVSLFSRNGGGTFKVTAGGTIANGDALTSDANGNAITATATATYPATASIIGYAQEAGVAGQVIEYLPTTGKI